jgi:hypothetical protein
MRRENQKFLSWLIGFFLSLLFIITSPTPFTPIEIGTFEITAADLKGIKINTTK